jgi:2,3-bisphosphoglycerate-independent phosphoglycerate mutase
MKYVIIIPDGCADEPQASLGNRTPLQAARLPHLDALAQAGVVGRANNVPDSLTPASDVATLSLFGYDPLAVYTGRAPLETVALGIHLAPGDWAIRCNLVHVPDGHMRDFTSGHITSADGAPLIAALHTALGGPTPDGGRLEFHAGVSYRNILVYRAGAQPAPFSTATKAQPPHDIPDRAVADYLPTGPGAELLRELMERSQPIIAAHPATAARVARGEKPATQIWLWGQGVAPTVTPFAQAYGPRGAIISAVDLVRGVGMLLGWKRIDVVGATGYLDTDYAAKGRAGVAALADHDLVCVHIEAPDEASHEGRVDAKIEALEQIDTHIVGPLRAALPAHGDYRILISPDHRTTVRTRAHAYGAVPFVVAGTGITPGGQASYDEVVAAVSPLSFDPGWQLMRWFLGLAPT